MTESLTDALAAYVDGVVAQLTKNGYPERRVAFSIERMYESASAKGFSFNKVLELLAARGIGHEKTPEKVIFSPTAIAPSMPAAFEGFDPAMFAGFDPAMFAGMSQEQLFATAQAAVQQMGPDQLEAVRAMVEGMTPEQQAAMIEQARKLGLG